MSNDVISPTEAVQRLRRLDCCAVSDALDRLKTGSVITGMAQRAGTGRIAGQAITMKLGTGEAPPGPPRHLGTTAIGLGGPDNIIVIEQRSGLDAGCWGGLLTLGAKVRGIAGVVADGPVRDIDEARTYGFPIFTRSTTSRTARGRIVELGTNVPINFEGAVVRPGDYVLADQSAVIIIGSADIANVLNTAEQIVAKESAMAKAILAGTPISEVMGGNYEHMLESLTS